MRTHSTKDCMSNAHVLIDFVHMQHDHSDLQVIVARKCAAARLTGKIWENRLDLGKAFIMRFHFLLQGGASPINLLS